MKAIKWITAGMLLIASTMSQAGDVDGIVVSHYEPLERLSMQGNETADSRKLVNAVPVTLSFDALGRSFDLRLESNLGWLSPAARSALADGVALYRGRIAGNPDSWTRITIAGGSPSGLIWDGLQLFAIEAPGDSAVSTDVPVIYRLADTFIVPGTMSCAEMEPGRNGTEMFSTLVDELKNADTQGSAAAAQGPGAVSEINFGAIGDFEFTSAFGNAADTEIIARLNNVDGIFSQQLGVQISVQTLETFSDPADPFTDASDSGGLLDELASYRRNTPAQRNQGLTHLFTGRELDTTTVGVAFTSALCNSRFGAGLTQATHGQTVDSLIAAHEIGHNFGAPHDSVSGSPCEDEPQTFLMAPSVNNSDQFSACSIAEMQDDIAAASCITALPSVDMTIATSAQLPTVLLSNTASARFDIINNGISEASNVSVEITVPNIVLLQSSESSAGNCTNGSGTVNCSLGNIVGGSAAAVSATTTTTGVGSGTFVATITADIDDNPGNNQATLQVTVDPAVNLVVNPPGALQVSVDQSTTVRSVIENRSTLGATGLILSISLDNSLRADSASWSSGTCTVSAQQVDCQASSLGGQSTSTLNVGVTGLTTGTNSYTVTLSSNEVDADPANNTIGGSITVNAVSGDSGDSGGGGATGAIFLWLLGCAGLLRSRP